MKNQCYVCTERRKIILDPSVKTNRSPCLDTVLPSTCNIEGKCELLLTISQTQRGGERERAYGISVTEIIGKLKGVVSCITRSMASGFQDTIIYRENTSTFLYKKAMYHANQPYFSPGLLFAIKSLMCSIILFALPDSHSCTSEDHGCIEIFGLG